MERRRLGRSGIVVSEICLGTMTYGSTLNEAESLPILSYAFENGVDFFDTAEVYPVPPRVEWLHESERILGNWMRGQDRASLIVASKVAGPSHGWFVPPVRGGHSAVDRLQIRRACEGSLRRLQTDYLDLYQVHWPDHDFGYEEVLETLTELVKEGKIRAFGSSNESAWGTMKAQGTAERLGTLRYETIQNNFSILNRRFEDALAEICRRERISLLPYSPIAGGVLSGKYNGGAFPVDKIKLKVLKLAGFHACPHCNWRHCVDYIKPRVLYSGAVYFCRCGCLRRTGLNYGKFRERRIRGGD